MKRKRPMHWYRVVWQTAPSVKDGPTLELSRSFLAGSLYEARLWAKHSHGDRVISVTLILNEDLRKTFGNHRTTPDPERQVR